MESQNNTIITSVFRTIKESGIYPFFFNLAVVEGRGLAKGEIGMAAINLKGSELSLFQVWIIPNLHYTVLKVINNLSIVP